MQRSRVILNCLVDFEKTVEYFYVSSHMKCGQTGPVLSKSGMVKGLQRHI